ncbi:MAG: response regulator transcription factor [Planctomycetota bacterium]|nr:response regulator transcription factor [Planctomycetota bacterium]
MKVMACDDDKITRLLLCTQLRKWGHEVVEAASGEEAIQIMTGADAPRLAILDWMLPGMQGPEVCAKLRELRVENPPYLILLTGKNEQDDLVRGFDSGADDYIVKPFREAELLARLRAGIRILDMQQRLSERVHALESALSKIKALQGLLPICAWCKKIRDDKNYWQKVETYLGEHTEARFTHCICPECREKQVNEFYKKISKSDMPAVPTSMIKPARLDASKPKGPPAP